MSDDIVTRRELAVLWENADRFAATLRKWSRIDPNDLEVIRAHDALRGHTPERTSE